MNTCEAQSFYIGDFKSHFRKEQFPQTQKR